MFTVVEECVIVTSHNHRVNANVKDLLKSCIQCGAIIAYVYFVCANGSIKHVRRIKLFTDIYSLYTACLINRL